MRSHFRDALQDARDVEDEPIEQTFDQANMVGEVLEGVRAIVREQVAEALPHASLYQNQIPPGNPDQFHPYNIQSVFGGNEPHNPTPQANLAYQHQLQPHNYATMHQPHDFTHQVHQQNTGNQPPPSQYNAMPPIPQPQQSGFSNFGQRGRGNRGRR